MVPNFEYGEKTFNAGDTFKLFEYDVTCVYVSAQIIRFELKRGDKILLLQKFLPPPRMRQPWRILQSNFVFELKGEVATGISLSHLFYHLDDYMKPKNRYDRSGKN